MSLDIFGATQALSLLRPYNTGGAGVSSYTPYDPVQDLFNPRRHQPAYNDPFALLQPLLEHLFPPKPPKPPVYPPPPPIYPPSPPLPPVKPPPVKPPVKPRPNPVRDHVTSLYNIILERKPDKGGLQHWITQVNNGMSDRDLIKNFFNSQEYKERFGGDHEGTVKKLYRSILGREAEPGGLAHWTHQLKSGVPLDRVINGFFNSQEYRANKLVPRLYEDILERKGEAGGLEHWRNQVNNGMSERDLVKNFFNSQEYKERFGNDQEGTVRKLYRVILGRNPDEGGFQHWLGQLRNGASINSLIDAFYNSQEYKDKLAG